MGWRQALPAAPYAVRRMWWVCVWFSSIPFKPPHSIATLPTNTVSSNACWFVFACSWTEMRGINALCECRDKRERAGVLRVKGRSGAAPVSGVRPSSWRLWGVRRDVWSGQSAALAALPHPLLSRSRTRGRPHWGWTLYLRGARTFHLWERGWKKKGVKEENNSCIQVTYFKDKAGVNLCFSYGQQTPWKDEKQTF